MIDGVLHRNWEDSSGNSFINQFMLPKVLEDLHSLPTLDHFGINKIMNHIRERFHWLRCRNNVTTVHLEKVHHGKINLF